MNWVDIKDDMHVVEDDVLLSGKNMEKELIQFETFEHKMRVKRIDAATSQLSIKSFFQPKMT